MTAAATLFSGSPPYRDASEVFSAWLTEPLGLFTRMAPGSHMSTAIAHYAAGLEAIVDAERARRGATVATYVHDWSGVRSYDTSARQALVEWPLKMKRGTIAEIVLITSPTMPRFVRMAYDVGGAALTVAGIRFSVTDDVDATVARLGLRPASRTG